MIKIRPKCPLCGTRLNEGAIEREVDLGSGEDVIEQDIGGRGKVSTVNSYDYDSPEGVNYADLWLEKIENAAEYLEDALGLTEEDEE